MFFAFLKIELAASMPWVNQRAVCDIVNGYIYETILGIASHRFVSHD
jgi:hypothetical protein